MGTADGAFNVLVRVGGEAEPPFSLAGAFNVLLNSLAVSFCLDVDDQLSSSTSVLLRLITESFMQRGPDICFLSAFPGDVLFVIYCATVVAGEYVSKLKLIVHAFAY